MIPALVFIPIQILYGIVISITYTATTSTVLAGVAIATAVVGVLLNIPVWIAIYSFRQELLGGTEGADPLVGTEGV